MSIDVPEKLPKFVRRAVKVYDHMMKVIESRCRVALEVPIGPINDGKPGRGGRPVNGQQKSKNVMPELNPAEKRAFDAAGFIMKTYYELKLIENQQNNVSFEELMEFSPEEQAAVAEDPMKMMTIFQRRKQEADKLAKRSESNRASASNPGNDIEPGLDALLAAR